MSERSFNPRTVAAHRHLSAWTWAGEYFLVTGSGKYFRNVIINPEDSICMIEVDEKGEYYRIVWGLEKRRTSYQ